jgi:hypothetical protein
MILPIPDDLVKRIKAWVVTVDSLLVFRSMPSAESAVHRSRRTPDLEVRGSTSLANARNPNAAREQGCPRPLPHLACRQHQRTRSSGSCTMTGVDRPPNRRWCFSSASFRLHLRRWAHSWPVRQRRASEIRLGLGFILLPSDRRRAGGETARSGDGCPFWTSLVGAPSVAS